MAELQTNPTKGGRRRPPLPRVELTPMVDLGFLLIAFFMFTTTMARPHVMTLNMPILSENRSRWLSNETIVLIPTYDHRVACYEGTYKGPQSLFWRSTTGSNGVRSTLLGKEKALRTSGHYRNGPNPLNVIIKPAPDCLYEDVISLLDEMHILGIRVYALVDLSETERAGLKNLR